MFKVVFIILLVASSILNSKDLDNNNRIQINGSLQNGYGFAYSHEYKNFRILAGFNYYYDNKGNEVNYKTLQMMRYHHSYNYELNLSYNLSDVFVNNLYFGLGISFDNKEIRNNIGGYYEDFENNNGRIFFENDFLEGSFTRLFIVPHISYNVYLNKSFSIEALVGYTIIPNQSVSLMARTETNREYKIKLDNIYNTFDYYDLPVVKLSICYNF